MATKFSVDPVIDKNSVYFTTLSLSVVYLKNDKANPWFILVPKKVQAEEIMDLTYEEQSVLMEELTVVSEFLKNRFAPFKLNIGSLGNIVRQLHLHVIARYEADRAWPGPIWGTPTTLEFNPEEIEDLREAFISFVN